MLAVTMNKQRKLYSRWLSMTEMAKYIRLSKVMNSLFMSVNISIKSVTDSAFTLNKDNIIKEKALIKLFANLSFGLEESFRRWRILNEL